MQGLDGDMRQQLDPSGEDVQQAQRGQRVGLCVMGGEDDAVLRGEGGQGLAAYLAVEAAGENECVDDGTPETGAYAAESPAQDSRVVDGVVDYNWLWVVVVQLFPYLPQRLLPVPPVLLGLFGGDAVDGGGLRPEGP